MARLNLHICLLGCLAAMVIGFLPEISQANNCVYRDKTDIHWNRYTWITEPDENGRYKFEVCAPALSHKVFEALIALEELGPLTLKRDAIDRGIIGAHPAKYFSGRVREIELHPSGGGICDGAIAYVLPNKPRVHICPSFADQSILEAMETLVHEARHTKDDVAHVKCLRRSLYGTRSACDSSFEAGGAYVVSTEFFVRVARSKSLPAAWRQEARSKFLYTFIHRFNKLHPIIKPKILLQDLNNAVFLADTNGKIDWLFNLEASQWLVAKTYYYPVAVNLFDGMNLRYLYNDDWKEDGKLTELSKFFKRPYLDKSGLSRLKDIVALRDAQRCVLIDGGSESTIECLSDKRSFQTKVGWAKPLYLGHFNNMLSFTSTDGKVYYNPLVLTPKNDTVRIAGHQSWDGFKELNTPHRYLSLFELDVGKYIGLNMEGQVVKIERTPLGQPVVVEPFKKYRFKKAVGPITWSRELDEI